MIHLLHIGESAHVAAIFEHGDGVAEGENLLHAVRNIENDAPLFAQLADHPEQVIYLARRE
ncbi:hypothetical protein D3C80_2148520 [compost metagenome]